MQKETSKVSMLKYFYLFLTLCILKLIRPDRQLFKLMIISAVAVDVTLSPTMRRTLKTTEYKLMEKELYKWLSNKKGRNLPISGGMIENIRKDVTLTSSEGCLKPTMALYFLKLQVDPFKQKLSRIAEKLKLRHQQMYRCR